MMSDWRVSLPRSWQVKRIKHTTYVKGRIGWQGLRSEEFGDEGPVLVTGTDFEEGRVNWGTCHHISDERYREDPYIHLQENDLLITKDGSIGKLALVNGLPGPATLNSGIFVTRPLRKEYLNDFLFYVLSSRVFTEFVNFRSSGTTIDHLYQNVFVDFAFPLPPIGEQKAIVASLTVRTAEIDDLIRKEERLIELLEENRQALISHAVTWGLDRSVPMKDSGVAWLGRVPTHWRVPRAKYLSRIFVPARDKPNLRDSGDFAWITLDEVRSHALITGSVAARWVDLDDLKASGGRVLQSGSVIASCVGEFGLGAIAVESCVINQQLQAYANPVLDAEFMRYCVEAGRQYFESVSTSTTIRYINQDRFGGFPLPQPPNEEQVEIVSYLKRLELEMKAMRQKVGGVIDRLREYRSALITAAVTGQLDLREHEKKMEALT